MKGSSTKPVFNNIFIDIITFTVPYSLGEIRENSSIYVNTSKNTYKELILNQAFKYHSEGNFAEAIKYYQYFIDEGFTDYRVLFKYGVILHDFGDLQQAEILIRKSIHIKSDFAEAHRILGNIFKNLGKLKESETSYLKAIELKPDLAKAYYSLSTLDFSTDKNTWQDKLFSKSILNTNFEDQADIYFARSNILHKRKKFIESSKYLESANKLKYKLKRSKSDIFIQKTKLLIIESDKQEIVKKEFKKYPQSIFIVGMPRSGSTLLESILSMNNIVYDLGEINIFEETFIDWRKSKQGFSLPERYFHKIEDYKGKFDIITNKWLYNYQYSGIILRQIPNAKIIHCFRHPLDNILSIYRTNFAVGNQYTYSLVDCANIYLDQDNVMTEYKKRFQNKIFDLNYDLLVSNSSNQIKSLISWLGWAWNDSYLTPHLNPRSILTASNVQVRSPINSKSIGGWKNYYEMLKPAIKILVKCDKYRDLTF